MSDILEVVFEEVSIHKLTKLLELITSESLEGEEKDVFIKESESLQESNCIQIKLNEMNIDGVIIRNVLLRVFRYGERVDVDFNFDIEEVSDNFSDKFSIFHDFINKIGVKVKHENYFAGMEPANDEDTRYFTRDLLGPLELNQRHN